MSDGNVPGPTGTDHNPTHRDQAALTLEIDGDGVAWLVFDRPGSKVNLLTGGVLGRLDELLEELEEATGAGSARALVVRSGKPGTFMAGADVGEIAGITTEAEGREASRAGQAIFRRLERLPVPSVAAIDGACVGGGTELVLACAYRLASDREETRIGLPEVRLGILPGFGGTVRLPRLIGLRSALDLILTGKSVSARSATRVGLVDERVPTPILLERAAEVALDPQGTLGHADRRKGVLSRLVEDTAPGRRLVLRMAERKVLEESGGHYPAPLEILETVRETLSMPLDRAFEREAEALGRLIVSPVSRNLVHVFQLVEGAKKAAPGAEPLAVERVGVLGAGVMGGGIAQLAAYHGLSVRLKDVRKEALSQGLHTARELFDGAVARRKLDREGAEAAMRRISPTLDYAGFGRVQLVIEAVVERMDVKKQVLREVEAEVAPDAVLSSNTSTLSITEMQEGLADPGRLCGMHFFNPVHRMPLVEVIRGRQSSERAVATVFAAARRLGKTPLIVNDGPGFLVNRLLAPYLNEAGWLLAEGAAIDAVDEALLAFGMPMGPFRLLDEIGLDVARHSGDVLHRAFGDRLAPAPPLRALETTERLGRKGGAGFYVYEGGKSRSPDATMYADLGETVPVSRTARPRDEVVDRCVLAMVNEAARALEDGIVAGAAEVDLGMITGTGFPPFRGGLLRYADGRGPAEVRARLEELRERHGERFAPAPLLVRLAEEGRRFYGEGSRQ